MSFYPAILHPSDAEGLHGVTVPGINVSASGASAEEALADAVTMLQEVVDGLLAAGEPLPAAVPLAEVEAGAGRVCLVPVTLPEKSVRVNITLPADLIARIDAVTGNRSAFLAKWARFGLRSEG